MNELNLHVGDIVYMNINECDTVRPYSIELEVQTVDSNHIIAVTFEANPSTYWIDDDTAYLFSRKPKYKVA